MSVSEESHFKRGDLKTGDIVTGRFKTSGTIDFARDECERVDSPDVWKVCGVYVKVGSKQDMKETQILGQPS